MPLWTSRPRTNVNTPFPNHHPITTKPTAAAGRHEEVGSSSRFISPHEKHLTVTSFPPGLDSASYPKHMVQLIKPLLCSSLSIRVGVPPLNRRPYRTSCYSLLCGLLRGRGGSRITAITYIERPRNRREEARNVYVISLPDSSLVGTIIPNALSGCGSSESSTSMS